ncbi:MAG TPA: hypothetical protein VE398_13160 [Acidobacteriota bacterium]|nr:hypothetical protein [Acidobacteriota bacterium]
MSRRKKRFVMFLVPLAVILLASLLAVQGPPNPCAGACLQTYRNAVIACHGDAACLAAAREELEGCIQGCNLRPPR